MDNKREKQKLLDQLYAPYQKCLMCPLGSLGRTKVVFGEGNPDARLMFIGEGPGANEDAQGRPFVGRSGQLLTKIIESTGLSRSDVFITNIVKCRPPENRKPFPLESKTCKGILLDKQIEIIKPMVICTLGSAALAGLLGQDVVKITQMRGIPLMHNGITILPTYHPAYILRNPKELEPLVVDINKAYELTQQHKNTPL
ncbi:MAG TPA: uracil-DNA glycosylase [Candidatus Limnocylindria bacterium]|nr:uracil-DNA glycosylase [Candidatus Limnocylindria bacterium]